MSRKSDIIFKGLSDIESEAVENYTGLNNVSAFMKNSGKFSPEFSETLRKYVDAISDLINKNHLEEEACLFRGIPNKDLSKIISADDVQRLSTATAETDVNDIFGRLNGKIVGNNTSFKSTTTCFDVARRFTDIRRSVGCDLGVFLIINAKKGLSHLPIMHHSKFHNEHEVLLGRNVRFKITNAIFKVKSSSCGGLSWDDKYLFLECNVMD